MVAALETRAFTRSKAQEELGAYSGIRLGVAPKNWPALRFWTATGFNRVVEIRGDKVYSDKSFAFPYLEPRLG